MISINLLILYARSGSQDLDGQDTSKNGKERNSEQNTGAQGRGQKKNWEDLALGLKNLETMAKDRNT